MSNAHERDCRDNLMSPRLQASGQTIISAPKEGKSTKNASETLIGVQMQLVPCRWQKSGWKYVEVQPGSTKFFSSPNRVNSVGFSPKVKPDSRFTHAPEVK